MQNRNSQTAARLIASIAIAGILVYGLFFLLMPFFIPVIMGIILASLSRPVYRLILKGVKNSTLSALLTVLVIIVLFLLPITIIIMVIIKEVSSVKDVLTDSTYSLDHLNHFADPLLTKIGITNTLNIQQYATTAISFLNSKTSLILGGVLGILGSIFLTLLTAFYLLPSQEKFHGAITQYSPLSREDTDRLVNRAREVVRATVAGNLLLMTVQALFSSLGFYLFGISAPILLGSLYGISSLVPAVGATLVWLPVAIFQLAQGNIFAGAGIICWALLQILLFDNYLGLRIIQSKTGLHPFLILLGVLGGVSQFGIVGVVVGPTIVALGIVGLELLYHAWQSHPE